MTTISKRSKPRRVIGSHDGDLKARSKSPWKSGVYHQMCEYSLKKRWFYMKTVFAPHLQPEVAHSKKNWGIGVS